MHPIKRLMSVGALFGLMGTQVHADAPRDAVRDLAHRDIPVIAGVLVDRDGTRTIDIEMSSPSARPAADPLVDIGSITKFVTAVAVLRLVDDGRFGLHTPISQLMDGVPADKRHITVHQLLTHSSGLIESTGSDEERLDRTEFIDRVMSAPLRHPAGTEYLYSNAGYSVLAALIELHSGTSYEDYLLGTLLTPNGLSAIGYESVYDEETSLRSRRSWVTSFRRLGILDASWGGHPPGWNLVGNGGLVTTTEGFLQFWSAFNDGEIVSAELVDLALTPHIDEGDGDTFYGYGVVVEECPDLGKIYWHDGGNEIFSAEWRHLADQRTTLFVAGLGDDAFEGMSVLLDAVQE